MFLMMIYFKTFCFTFFPVVYIFATTSIVCTFFTAIVNQILKRIILYTSVALMNLVFLGIFGFNVIGSSNAYLRFCIFVFHYG